MVTVFITLMGVSCRNIITIIIIIIIITIVVIINILILFYILVCAWAQQALIYIIDINLFWNKYFCTAIVVFKQDYLRFSFETKVISTVVTFFPSKYLKRFPLT